MLEKMSPALENGYQRQDGRTKISENIIYIQLKKHLQPVAAAADMDSECS